MAKPGDADGVAVELERSGYWSHVICEWLFVSLVMSLVAWLIIRVVS